MHNSVHNFLLPSNVIVAGIARSGLTATCHMLAAGGLRVAGEHPAYEPYPIGETPWGRINGQAVKLVDSHLHFPPPGEYAVIRLRRDLQEQCRSFDKLVGALGLPAANPADTIASFKRDYAKIDAWAGKQMASLTLEFEELITSPLQTALNLQSFLGIPLDSDAAAAAVLRRSPKCHPQLLEVWM